MCTEDEFMCHDRTCIDITERCDFANDCEDGSDEDNCSKFIYFYFLISFAFLSRTFSRVTSKFNLLLVNLNEVDC